MLNKYNQKPTANKKIVPKYSES